MRRQSALLQRALLVRRRPSARLLRIAPWRGLFGRLSLRRREARADSARLCLLANKKTITPRSMAANMSGGPPREAIWDR